MRPAALAIAYCAVAFAAAPPAAAAPPNDNLANAALLSGSTVTTTGTNVLATAEPGEPDHAGVSQPLASVWYRWTAARSGPTSFDTCAGGSFDTALAVYTKPGSGGVSSLVELASNDDADAPGCAGGESLVTTTVSAGTTYYIALDGKGWATGTFQLTIRGPAPPANDRFADAQPLSGVDLEVIGTNRYATGEPGEPNHAGASSPLASVWYRWTAPENRLTGVDLCASDFDTTLGVYRGSSVANLTKIASNDDLPWPGCGLGTSYVEFEAQAGATYWIAVDGFEDATGDIDLQLYTAPPQAAGTQSPPTPGTPLVHKPAPPPATTPGPLDTTAPGLGLRFKRVAMSGTGRVALRIACPRSEVSCSGRVALATARRVKLGHRRIFARIGRARFKLAGGETASVVVQLTRAARRLVGRAHRLRVKASFVTQDAAGNIGTADRIFVITRPSRTMA